MHENISNLETIYDVITLTSVELPKFSKFFSGRLVSIQFMIMGNKT